MSQSFRSVPTLEMPDSRGGQTPSVTVVLNDGVVESWGASVRGERVGKHKRLRGIVAMRPELPFGLQAGVLR